MVYLKLYFNISIILPYNISLSLFSLFAKWTNLLLSLNLFPSPVSDHILFIATLKLPQFQTSIKTRWNRTVSFFYHKSVVSHFYLRHLLSRKRKTRRTRRVTIMQQVFGRKRHPREEVSTLSWPLRKTLDSSRRHRYQVYTCICSVLKLKTPRVGGALSPETFRPPSRVFTRISTWLLYNEPPWTSFG